LASNSTVFQNKYGMAPFGQFTRNLSNKSQKIVLADAYGNIIDSVEYFDADPWPTSADGCGTYLDLVNTALDNNIASSWVAKNDNTSTTQSFLPSSSFTIYTNPVFNSITIQSEKVVTGVKVFTILGALVQEVKT
jgi:hypothetical protein